MGNKQTFEQFDRFEDLPKPALQEILLKLNRQQLHAICSISRKAFSICSENNFREIYNQSHPKQMIYGNLNGYLNNRLGRYILTDDMGTIISFKLENEKIYGLFYNGHSSPDYKNIMFDLSSRRVFLKDLTVYLKLGRNF